MISRRLILGSGSPRRTALLDALDVPYTVRVADVDERSLWSHDVEASVRRSATAKFDALLPDLGPLDVLLTADTMVAADAAGPDDLRSRSPLGKPVSMVDARRMLERVAGSTITIVSAVVCGTTAEAPTSRLVETRVRLIDLTNEAIESYLATGAAEGKAGALELQDRAGPFIESVHGCWSNVVGFPLCVVAEVLANDFDVVAEPCAKDRCGR